MTFTPYWQKADLINQQLPLTPSKRVFKAFPAPFSDLSNRVSTHHRYITHLKSTHVNLTPSPIRTGSIKWTLPASRVFSISDLSIRGQHISQQPTYLPPITQQSINLSHTLKNYFRVTHPLSQCDTPHQSKRSSLSNRRSDFTSQPTCRRNPPANNLPNLRTDPSATSIGNQTLNVVATYLVIPVFSKL